MKGVLVLDGPESKRSYLSYTALGAVSIIASLVGYLTDNDWFVLIVALVASVFVAYTGAASYIAVTKFKPSEGMQVMTIRYGKAQGEYYVFESIDEEK